jgi:hypothetical protein
MKACVGNYDVAIRQKFNSGTELATVTQAPRSPATRKRILQCDKVVNPHGFNVDIWQWGPLQYAEKPISDGDAGTSGRAERHRMSPGGCKMVALHGPWMHDHAAHVPTGHKSLPASHSL